jgi:hypothetical protein
LASAHARLSQPTEMPAGGCHQHHQSPRPSAPSTPLSQCCLAGHQTAIVETGSTEQNLSLLAPPVQRVAPIFLSRLIRFATSMAYHSDRPQRTPFRI